MPGADYTSISVLPSGSILDSRNASPGRASPALPIDAGGISLGCLAGVARFLAMLL